MQVRSQDLRRLPAQRRLRVPETEFEQDVIGIGHENLRQPDLVEPDRAVRDIQGIEPAQHIREIGAGQRDMVDMAGRGLLGTGDRMDAAEPLGIDMKDRVPS